MWGWYRDAADRPPPPASISLDTLTEERSEIYTHVPPLGRPIPIYVYLFPVDENIPGEGGISEAVMRIRLHCAEGPSVMRAEHLGMWLHAATREERVERCPVTC